jgi:hypothetical protein
MSFFLLGDARLGTGRRTAFSLPCAYCREHRVFFVGMIVIQTSPVSLQPSTYKQWLQLAQGYTSCRAGHTFKPRIPQTSLWCSGRVVYRVHHSLERITGPDFDGPQPFCSIPEVSDFFAFLPLGSETMRSKMPWRAWLHARRRGLPSPAKHQGQGIPAHINHTPRPLDPSTFPVNHLRCVGQFFPTTPS